MIQKYPKIGFSIPQSGLPRVWEGQGRCVQQDSWPAIISPEATGEVCVPMISLERVKQSCLSKNWERHH